MLTKWEQMISSIEPNLVYLKKYMKENPNITVELKQSNRGSWEVSLIYLDEIDPYYFEDYLGERINWTDNILENWPAWRSNYSTWTFSSKEDAEKFITYYLLKWPINI